MRRAGDTQALALQGGHDHYGCVMHIETTPEDHRIAWLLFIPHPAIWGLFPAMMTAALLFGVINGIIAGAMTTEPRQCRT